MSDDDDDDVESKSVSRSWKKIDLAWMKYYLFHRVSLARPYPNPCHHLPKGWFWLYDIGVSMNRWHTATGWTLEWIIPKSRQVIAKLCQASVICVVQIKWTAWCRIKIVFGIAEIVGCMRVIPRANSGQSPWDVIFVFGKDQCVALKHESGARNSINFSIACIFGRLHRTRTTQSVCHYHLLFIYLCIEDESWSHNNIFICSKSISELF